MKVDPNKSKKWLLLGIQSFLKTKKIQTMKTGVFILTLAIAGFFISCNPATPKADEKKTSCSDSCTCKAPHAKIIAAKIYIKPDKISEFTEMFKGMTENTLKEPGCTGYQLYQNPYEPTSFLVYESYKNQEAIDAHFAADYFKDFGAKVQPLTSKATEISIIDVATETKK